MTISLSAQLTAVVVTFAMALFLSAVVILSVIPVLEALIGRRKITIPDLPATFENLGIALALVGFTARATEVSAIGVGLVFLGACLAARRVRAPLHPVLEKSLLVSGIVSLGVLAEFFYLAT